MDPQIIRDKITRSLADARIEVQDLTGTRDHFRVTIVSRAFEGKRLVDQHRMIYEILHDSMEAQGGGIHALSLATYTPEEFTKKGEKNERHASR